MLREAGEFRDQMRKCERAIRTMLSANQDAVGCGSPAGLLLACVQTLLCCRLAPLPAHLPPRLPAPGPRLPAQAAAIKAVMAAPLPRRFEETAAAAGGATSGGTIGGDGFSSDALARAMQGAGHKLEGEVLAPLQRWQEVYGTLAVSGGGCCQLCCAAAGAGPVQMPGSLPDRRLPVCIMTTLLPALQYEACLPFECCCRCRPCCSLTTATWSG